MQTTLKELNSDSWTTKRRVPATEKVFVLTIAYFTSMIYETFLRYLVAHIAYFWITETFLILFITR